MAMTMNTLTSAEWSTLATFAASYAVLHLSHDVADHVSGQTDWQAANKAAPTPTEIVAGAHRHRRWAANAAHVGQYHLTMAVLGVLAWSVLPLPWSVPGVLSALTWSAGTHALLDRRSPVRWLLNTLGSPKFAQLDAGGLGGLHAADQALHGVALGIAAWLLAVL